MAKVAVLKHPWILLSEARHPLSGRPMDRMAIQSIYSNEYETYTLDTYRCYRDPSNISFRVQLLQVYKVTHNLLFGSTSLSTSTNW